VSHACIFCGQVIEVDDLQAHAVTHNKSFGKLAWEIVEQELYAVVDQE